MIHIINPSILFLAFLDDRFQTFILMILIALLVVKDLTLYRKNSEKLDEICRLFLWYVQLPPQPETGITGIATYADGITPLAGATAQVADEGGNILGTSEPTGEDGAFKALSQAGENLSLTINYNGEVVYNVSGIIIVQGNLNNLGVIGTNRGRVYKNRNYFFLSAESKALIINPLPELLTVTFL